MTSLGEAFPQEQARLREILKSAHEIGPPGRFLCAMIEECLQRADKAAMSQDIVKMFEVYQEMKAFKE